jgi:hypothetical protein
MSYLFGAPGAYGSLDTPGMYGGLLSEDARTDVDSARASVAFAVLGAATVALLISAACVRQYTIWKQQERSFHTTAPGFV